MSEKVIDLSHKDKGPRLTCKVCGGRGSYFDPKLPEQQAQQARGERKHIVRKICVCIVGG